MHLGTRPIRTAGRGSGSVEVTLPTQLRPMVGLSCHIFLQDGARPDIVLSPDLTPARAAFGEFWSRLAAATLHAAAPPAWRSEDFTLSVSPRPPLPGVPALAWEDGLVLAHQAAPHAAIGRVSHACLAALAAADGMAPAAAADFAASGAVLCGGVVLHPDWHRAADQAARLLGDALWRPGCGLAAQEDWRAESFWRALAPSLAALAGSARAAGPVISPPPVPGQV